LLKALSKGKPNPGPPSLRAVGSTSWKPGCKHYGLEAGPGFFTLLSTALAGGCCGLMSAVFNWVVDNVNNVNDMFKYVRKPWRI